MLRWPLRHWFGLAVTGFVIAVLLTPDPDQFHATAMTSQQLVDVLNQPAAASRQRAAEQLVLRGKTVVPLLEEAARNASGTWSERIIAVLEELLLSSDEDVSIQAERSLERLAMGETRELTTYARNALYRHSGRIHSRALASVVELGGVVFTQERELAIIGLHEGRREFNDWVQPTGNTIKSPMNVLLLDERWKGGDEGLEAASRLHRGDPFSIHVTDEAQVSEEALRRLVTSREQRPSIVRPNQGCLGVVFGHQEPYRPVGISSVVVGSPADHAGLQPGDIVLRCGESRPKTQADLSREIRNTPPGHTLLMTVRRYNRVIDLEIVLGSDFGTGQCQCTE
jgi:hypothetical protein